MGVRPCGYMPGVYCGTKLVCSIKTCREWCPCRIVGSISHQASLTTGDQDAAEALCRQVRTLTCPEIHLLTAQTITGRQPQGLQRSPCL